MTTMASAQKDREDTLGGPDAQSRAWIADLRSSGRQGDEAAARLHELLLRAARFEVNRRRTTMPHLRGNDFDDVAMQSADDALVKVLSKLDSYRGDSKFTTWAYKFALLEAAVNLQRRAWQGREVPSSLRPGLTFRLEPPPPRLALSAVNSSRCFKTRSRMS